MSIKINVIDPCSQNLAKLINAIGDYMGSNNQKIEAKIDLKWIKEDKSDAD